MPKCKRLTCPLFCGCGYVVPKPPPPTPEPILTPEEKEELVRAGVRTLRRIARRRGLQSLAHFVRQSFATKYPGTPLEWGPHIQAICDHIQWQLEDRARVRRDPSASLLAQNMIINCVPRSLKSFIVSCATLWAWIHWPEMKIMILSSNPRVTLDGARIVRDLIDSEWFRLTYDVPWKIRPDQDALSDLGNTAGGTRAARGMDATVTGAGCNWLCVTGDTLVATEVGDVRMDDLVAMAVKPRVWSMSREGRTELKHITKAWYTGERETVRVASRSGHVLHCTDDHRIWTSDGYLEAQSVAGRTLSVLPSALAPAQREADSLSRVRERDADVPCHAPQIDLDTAASVEPCIEDGCRTTVSVYDINVEDNHNFFAGGILVHNCVDDPIDARASTQTRTQVNEGYKSAVHNRINDPRCDIRLLIMQRLGRDDLSGDCLRSGEWLHVRIPATFRKHTTCKCVSCARPGKNVFGWEDWRREGEVVHPRFTPKFLAGERSRLGSAGYAAQLDQEPVDMQGGMVPRGWWSFFRLSGHTAGDWPRPAGCDEKAETLVVPLKGKRWDFDTIAITVDAAAKKTTKGSQYGMLVCAIKGARRFVLDDRTQRGSFTEILVILEELMIKWRPRKLIIEDKAAGPDLIDTLRNRLAGGNIVAPDGEVITCVVEEINPDGDKERRMEAASPTIESRQVYLLEGASWLDEFVSEVADFPAEPNDRGDALSQFITASASAGNAMWGVTPNVWATALMGGR